MAEEAVYIISVAARLVEMHPQTLRKYERAGFLEPSRSTGNLRLYSTDDIDRLFQIKQLVDILGVNLAGVEMALALTRRVQQLQQILARDEINRDALSSARALVEEMLGDLGVLNRASSGGTTWQR